MTFSNDNIPFYHYLINTNNITIEEACKKIIDLYQNFLNTSGKI